MSGSGLGAVLLAALLGDLALEYLIGLNSLHALTRKVEVAAGLAIAMVLVAPIVSVGCHLWLHQVLLPMRADYLAVPGYVLIVVLVAHGASLVARSLWPASADWARLYPLFITVDCAVLGVALISLATTMTVFEAFTRALGLALGYGVLLIVISALRERLAAAAIPRPFHGMPSLLLALSILAMALGAIG